MYPHDFTGNTPVMMSDIIPCNLGGGMEYTDRYVSTWQLLTLYPDEEALSVPNLPTCKPMDN